MSDLGKKLTAEYETYYSRYFRRAFGKRFQSIEVREHSARVVLIPLPPLHVDGDNWTQLFDKLMAFANGKEAAA